MRVWLLSRVPFLKFHHFLYRVSLDGLTPCHAAALSGRVPLFTEELKKGYNPLLLVRSWLVNFWSLTSYTLHDSQCQKQCLEYLVQYGGDLNINNNQQETPKDIAKRRQKKAIVGMIDEYCEFVQEASYGID